MNWLDLIAWISLILSLAQAVVIAVDIFRNRQTMMPIMNAVWPLIGLFFPVVGIWAYFGLGREQSSQSHSDASEPEKPFWQSVFVSTTHCSAGCSLGDMIGAPLVFLTGILIAGSTLLTDYIVEFVLAYIFGIAFQYFGMGFTKHKDPKAALKNAIKADTLSLLAFEVGMFGWMALVSLVFFATPPRPDSPTFWLMMQIAMMLGFLTSFPANWVLVRRGVKHAM